MRAAILGLVAATALAITAGTADARPPRAYGGYHHGYYNGGYNHGYYYPNYYGSGVRVYPSINTSPYWGGYYGGYYPSYAYPASGFSLNLGNFGLSIGNAYPYYGGYGYGSPWYW